VRTRSGASIKHYLTRHREQPVETVDSRAHLEATGRDTERFFDEWVYGWDTAAGRSASTTTEEESSGSSRSSSTRTRARRETSSTATSTGVFAERAQSETHRCDSASGKQDSTLSPEEARLGSRGLGGGALMTLRTWAEISEACTRRARARRGTDHAAYPRGARSREEATTTKATRRRRATIRGTRSGPSRGGRPGRLARSRRRRSARLLEDAPGTRATPRSGARSRERGRVVRDEAGRGGRRRSDHARGRPQVASSRPRRQKALGRTRVERA